MKKKRHFCRHWFNYLACFLSLIAICCAYIRCKPIEMDWVSVLVGILSLLVTVLLGWQIYSVIDIKKTVSEIKSHTNKAYEETMARAYTSIMNQTSHIVEGRENDDCYNAIANGLFACKHFYLAQNYYNCKGLISIISKFDKNKCRLSQKNIQDLYQIIGQLKECGIDVSPIEEWLNNYSLISQNAKSRKQIL